MSTPFYNYLIYSHPQSDATFDNLYTKLRSLHSDEDVLAVVTKTDQMITVTFNNYNFYIHYNDAPHVMIEARDTATETDLMDYADVPVDADILSACDRRFELSADLDPDMDHFNESLFITEVFEAFSDIVILFQD